MTNANVMRIWYVPVEVLTLKRWLIAAFIINILLLTIDVLREDNNNLILGILGCIVLFGLRANLPEMFQRKRRDISLILSALIVGI